MHRLLPFIAAIITLGACSHRAADNKRDVIPGLDSLPAPLRTLITAVADSDSVAFAGMVSYPLERPYPLHSITDAGQMKRYYSTLADDSLRREITAQPLSRWQQYGWRGWSVDGSYCIWVDDSIYSIPYVSKAEKTMRDKLITKEMASLAPSMRGAWTPVGCYREADGPLIFRIDKSTESGVTPVFRLAVYRSAETMRLAPEAIFTGSQQIDGTVMGISYHFKGPKGSTAEFLPEPLDESLPEFEFVIPQHDDTVIRVRAAYWLDILPRKR